ncbi:MAG: GTP 3',8-cyclase MoaA [Bacteroidota bacterium]
MRKTAAELYDNHGRQINYLRLAVTDRCNLRCFYCMPEEGIKYVPRRHLLRYEEMLRLISLLATMGISKLRITGGEPFLRKEMMSFLRELTKVRGLEQIHITTNGTLTAGLVPELKALGIRSVNLSLDSLDAERFRQITRRDQLDTVMETFRQLQAYDIPTKINMVVMAGRNTDDIIPMAELSRHHAVGVRFIEEMPFNGEGGRPSEENWHHRQILATLQTAYPDLQKLPDPPFSTSANYQVPGFKGQLGIIAAYSRTFCGTCNRIRITPKGLLKTCLYDDGIFNVKDLMRAGADDRALRMAFLEALSHRAKDGFEAERRRQFSRPISESMSSIGG